MDRLEIHMRLIESEFFWYGEYDPTRRLKDEERHRPTNWGQAKAAPEPVDPVDVAWTIEATATEDGWDVKIHDGETTVTKDGAIMSDTADSDLRAMEDQ